MSWKIGYSNRQTDQRTQVGLCLGTTEAILCSTKNPLEMVAEHCKGWMLNAGVAQW